MAKSEKAELGGVLDLTRDNAFIFRITHIDNVRWILRNGLHCKNSPEQDPHFVGIGNEDLINKRTGKPVPVEPFGTLSDYIPFYFTPHSPMMYNIHTGYGGITRRSNEEIVIMVSSLNKLSANGVRFVFTDRHAYLSAAEFSSDLADLGMLDWDILRQRDFRRDPEDPEKVERYQAEALVHETMSVEDLRGIAACSSAVADKLRALVQREGSDVKIASKPSWYF